MNAPRVVRTVAWLVVPILVAAGCNRGTQSTATGDAAKKTSAAAAPSGQYPAPRWPSYFKPPKSAEDLMPAARSLVRNRSGLQGKGMGILNPGDSVLIVMDYAADPMVIEAIKRALEERKITPHFKYTYELLGETREEASKLQNTLPPERISNAGIYQASQFIDGQFYDPNEPKKWLKEKSAKLFDELYPVDGPEERARLARRKLDSDNMGPAIQKYLRAHPEIVGCYWGIGGSTSLRRALYPMQDKFLGIFVTDNVYDLQSVMSSYPGDVWQLAEEQQMEPIQYSERVEIVDPEGTNAYFDVPAEMADRWAAGAYQRGHLYMIPNDATGRFGYSFVNYPAFAGKWLAREPIARIEGVMAGTQGHGGFFPRWEVTWKDGFISDVKGGGALGEALKEFIHYPHLNELTYPYHKNPGYWYLYEIAFGTHPKGFRVPKELLENGSTLQERVRSGVIHWGLGIRVVHDPDAPSESKVWREFWKKHNVPYDHGWHNHTYFTTYRMKLRNTDKWAVLLDKGHMTSLDDPEVRALASRYGDPGYLLTEDWIPEVPGINAPGDYLKDYAPDPGKFALMVMQKAKDGTYAHYFPTADVNSKISGGQ